ncbi:GPR endopeptidase [Clostridium algidicarnis]|uniref:Germination protease n=1 Tax=Clostridium algidicarnis DSM 15099 TaxID=1121295 RepID=A0A2S6G0Y2_9CLOT|nr:GPR endopeptidase [Clostridium algidicarnis]MBU3202999.1 GPR endopeptidase [Clostridium algidicarnis]MBU3205702.1 GPR endopeptidase [Clostridium algidicarnis]MBU3211153.1 GPR endopeptidase [Clostridium algidicarnis]MBU3222339.1 GPR endopeptidase [Clostridium algidicarnis]MCB2286507.1 GPR endopeptidase [Clostridium algidicarnis]
MFEIRTDLAVEAREMYSSAHNKDPEGIVVKEDIPYEDIKVTKVSITNEEGEKNMGKPIGNYITIDIPEFTYYDGETMNRVSKVVADSLSKIINKDKHRNTLVIGLGNWNVTPDALGPRVISKTMITRHLKELIPDKIDEKIASVSALSPGVLGLTGIETVEIVKGVVDKTKPDLIICVDALASRRLDRVNRTIQISDTGISPGSGLKNHRKALNIETLGIKVIAIGVPTVVDAATIANDSIDLVLDEMIKESTKGGEFYNMLKSIDKNEKGRLIEELLSSKGGDLIVTPKEVDIIVDSVSRVISNGINLALQPSLDLEDINQFMN